MKKMKIEVNEKERMLLLNAVTSYISTGMYKTFYTLDEITGIARKIQKAGEDNE